MHSLTFVVIAVFVLAFGLVSGRVQDSVITPAMVAVAFGFLVGERVLGLVELNVSGVIVETLAELTLVLVLFTDAARIDLRALRREHGLPVRLLTLALPLTILCGTAVGAIVFSDMALWSVAVLAIILTPTDAALGQSVVSSPRVPVRIRQTLNVESGLNDGAMLPILLIALSLAVAAAGDRGFGYWSLFAAKQITLGPLVGVAVGYLGGDLIERASRNGWMTRSFQDLSALGLSLLAFAAAELVGGNGFIAAFCAGLTLGNSSRAICGCLYEFAEAEGQLLTLLMFMLFGAMMVPGALDHLGPRVILYAVLSLTVVRIVPVAIALLGARLRADTVLFLGWFGPRGIASILFGLLVLERSDLAGREQVFLIMTTTVLLSTFAHGLTAAPAARWYARRLERAKAEPDVAEHVRVSEMPVRLPFPT